VYEQLKDKKTESGFTLKGCVNSGLTNPDSGVGVYSGDEDSYSVFGALFDPLIESYHGHTKEASHSRDLEWNKISGESLDADGEFILSTRIRVGRNLKGMPLAPLISKAQRKEVESKVTESLSTFEGDLSGKYYSLESLSEDERSQLIADHFLFKEGDRFLAAAGANRDWPSGRGIFHNDEKTFLVWVNEEDQLRIISMEKGGDIKSVFSRLCRAIEEMERRMEFAFNSHLGNISSCPTNLGTAMRASVHIKLPLLGSHKEEFQSIADAHQVQIRGIHGEHSSTDGGIFDISNRRRLGLSEVECVESMYRGVAAMIARERELRDQSASSGEVEGSSSGEAKEAEMEKKEESKEEEKQPEENEKEDPFPWTGELEEYPSFPDDCHSLLKKCLTKDVYEQLKDKKTESGFTLKGCVNSGLTNPDSGVGVYSGDEDSYSVFGALFDPLIESYHGHTKEASHSRDLEWNKISGESLDADGEFILSTRIRVGRNLKGMPLAPLISKAQRKEVESKVTESLSTFEGDLSGKYYSLESLSEDERSQLIADHFLFKEGDRFLAAAGANRDWPSGRGIFHNDEKTFLVWVNEEDQLRIISMEKGGDIKSVFSRLCRAIEEMERRMEFAFNSHLGNISSCPTNLGTAMRASVHIKLPLLGSHKEEFQSIADAHQVQIRGIHGEHSSTDGGIFDISNRRRLGLSEVECVESMYRGVAAMIARERELRDQSASSGEVEGSSSGEAKEAEKVEAAPEVSGQPEVNESAMEGEGAGAGKGAEEGVSKGEDESTASREAKPEPEKEAEAEKAMLEVEKTTTEPEAEVATEEEENKKVENETTAAESTAVEEGKAGLDEQKEA